MTRALLWFTLLATCPAAAEFVSFQAIDEAGKTTPVRMEILDAAGRSYVPDAALPIQIRCPSEPVPNDAPGCMTGFSLSNFIDNPHTGTRQFYVDGAFAIDLPPGAYTVAAFKGIEYSVDRMKLDVVPFENAPVVLSLKRWADSAAKGWFSADDHLHIERLTPADDAYVARWAQAEDLNVANLIQMGNEQAFDAAKQFAFGEPGTYLAGNTLILSGQENPRTHVFGHSLILGADQAIEVPHSYSVYDNFFQLGHRLNGLNGYAHWGLGPAETGLAMDAPRKLLSFMEVLQFEYAHYDVWYQLLNLGIPMAPTAGTDFPCGPWSVPGRERFYTKVEGKLTRQSWLEGVRRGRTFVTNGPLLELTVDDAEIGDQLTIRGAKTVVVRGKVTFDPIRDSIAQVVLVRNGISTPVATKKAGTGTLLVEARVPVAESAWFALRATGTKVGETALASQGHSDVEYALAATYSAGVSMSERETFAAAAKVRPAEAHTGAIYVELSSGKPVARQPRSQLLARAWLTRLDVLEIRLKDENIGSIPLALGGLPNSDGVSLEDLVRNRKQLLRLIAEARTYFRGLLD